MAQQPTSMIGHLYANAKKAAEVVFMNPVSRFVFRTLVEMGERLIPHGASELGQALYGGGSAYAPPGVTERLGQPPDKDNVHGSTQKAASAVQTPVVAPVTNRVPEKDFNTILAEASARLPAKDQSGGRER